MLGTNPFDFVAPVFTLDMNKIVESARYLQNEIANNNRPLLSDHEKNYISVRQANLEYSIPDEELRNLCRTNKVDANFQRRRWMIDRKSLERWIENQIQTSAHHQATDDTLDIKRRRLRVLKEQAARYGQQCPPHIILEIEDLRKDIGDDQI